MPGADAKLTMPDKGALFTGSCSGIRADSVVEATSRWQEASHDILLPAAEVVGGRCGRPGGRVLERPLPLAAVLADSTEQAMANLRCGFVQGAGVS